MANEKNNRRRVKKPRQEWNPHWLLKLLYTVGSVALSLLKIAIGAAATVVLILLVCGVVFVGTLGDYLQDDILTDAVDWSMDDYDMEETSFIYYVDNDGHIQQLQQVYTTTDRQWASLDEIPQHLIDAAVAIEDKRFYLLALPQIRELQRILCGQDRLANRPRAGEGGRLHYQALV